MKNVLHSIVQSKTKSALFLLLPAIIVYIQVKTFDFSPLDEQWMILKSQAELQHWKTLLTSFHTSIADYYYRPLVTCSFVIDYHLGKINPGVYHFTNLLLHLACVLVFFKLMLLFGFDRMKAFLVALLFSLHPVLVHAVAWVPGRNDSLLCLFSLASVYFLKQYYMHASIKNFLLHLLFFILALFTKETAVILPPVFLILHVGSKQPFSLKESSRLGMYVLLLVAWWLLRVEQVVGLPDSGMSLSERGLSFLKVLCIYCGKAVLPLQLSIYPTLANSSLILPLLTLGVTGFCIYKFGFEKKEEALSYLLVFFLWVLIPSWYATTKSNSELYEHRIYAALPWLLMGLGLVRWPTKYIGYVLLLVVVFFSVYTHQRAKHYKNLLSFSDAGIKESPDFYLFYQIKGDLAYAKKDIRGALAYSNKAIQIRPDKGELYSNRGSTHFALGNYKEAIRDFSEAIAKAGKRKEFVLNRCIAYGRLNKIDSALQDYVFLKACCPDFIPEKLKTQLDKLVTK